MKSTTATISELFTVPIYSVDLDLDLDNLRKFCKYIQNHDATGRKVSNYGGYQSKELPLNTEVLDELLLEVHNHANFFASKFINEAVQKVGNMWFNVNGYKDLNMPHNHPDSHVSGVVYVDTPTNCGKLLFQHPNMETLSYYEEGANITNRNAYNSQIWEFQPKENRMFLFPSWVIYSVNQNLNKTKKRLSFAFNTKHHES